MTGRVAIAACALAAGIAGCTHVREAQPPHNADERLADEVMDAIERGDMRAELDRFVAERRASLLDPVRVKSMHETARAGGDFLGAREVPQKNGRTSTVRSFVAAFSRGDQALTILFDDSGKIVHYRIGGALSEK